MPADNRWNWQLFLHYQMDRQWVEESELVAMMESVGRMATSMAVERRRYTEGQVADHSLAVLETDKRLGAE